MKLLERPALFFDFDGLLVNSEHLHYEAYKLMLAKHGGELPWDLITYLGIAHKSATGIREVITEHFPHIVESVTWEVMYQEKKEIYQELLGSGKLHLMPGAAEVLERIAEAGTPRCVATNSTLEQVNAIKKQLPELDSIPLWITREDYERPKPAPDSYLVAAEKLGVSTEGAAGFEDSLRGVNALIGAQIDPVLICPNSHPQMDDVPEGVIHFESFENLLRS